MVRQRLRQLYSDIQTDSHVPLVLSQVVVPVVLSNGQTEVETIVQTFRQTLRANLVIWDLVHN